MCWGGDYEGKNSFSFLYFARDIIAEQMFNTSQGYKIGGLGLTVEIDESMFGLLLK